MHTILILDDGSTWASVDGAELITVTDEGMKALEESGDPKDIPDEYVVTSVTFRDTGQPGNMLRQVLGSE